MDAVGACTDRRPVAAGGAVVPVVERGVVIDQAWPRGAPGERQGGQCAWEGPSKHGESRQLMNVVTDVARWGSPKSGVKPRPAPLPGKRLLRQRCRACGRLHGVPQLQQVLRIELEGALLALRI